MKKTYMTPAMETIEVKTTGMLAVSGGVGNGSTPGNEFNGSDESYSPGFDIDTNMFGF